MSKIDPHNYPGPIEELEEHEKKAEKNKTQAKIVVVIGFTVALIGGIVAFLAENA